MGFSIRSGNSGGSANFGRRVRVFRWDFLGCGRAVSGRTNRCCANRGPASQSAVPELCPGNNACPLATTYRLLFTVVSKSVFFLTKISELHRPEQPPIYELFDYQSCCNSSTLLNTGVLVVSRLWTWETSQIIPHITILHSVSCRVFSRSLISDCIPRY